MKKIKIGILTDIQYCDSDPDTEHNRYFRNSLQKVDQIIQIFNVEDLDFIVNLGDTIDKNFESFDTITKKLSHFNAPLFNLIGNHDYDVAPEKKKFVPAQLGLKDNYYYFDIEGFRYCFLDGNEISGFSTEKDSSHHKEAIELLAKMRLENKANANEWNGGMSSDQINWFRLRLQEALRMNLKVIVFCHYPIFPEGKHSLLNNIEILDIIDEHSHIAAWFCGHNHDGNYDKINNCHILNFKAIVDTEDENAFSIIEVTDESLKLKAWGREIVRALV